jgi:hypothetical protein
LANENGRGSVVKELSVESAAMSVTAASRRKRNLQELLKLFGTCPDAANVLHDIMMDPKAPYTVRAFCAANWIDRALGKPWQSVEVEQQVAVLVRQSARVAGHQPPAAIAALRFDDFDVAHVFCRTISTRFQRAARPNWRRWLEKRNF